MKILEVTNVDFSLRHFLLPLMRGIRARGHEAVGVSAEGPLLAEVRAEGFRVAAVPMARRLDPLAQLHAYAALRRLIREERPDIVHAHMPISGVLARFAARREGVPRIAYTCHGFLFNQPGSRLRRAASLLAERAAGRVTDLFMTVSEAEAADARARGIHAHPVAIRNGRDPARFAPSPAARARIRAELGVPPDRVVIIAVSRLVRHKGYPELLAAMRDLPAELWVIGERLASDRGEDLAPLFAGSGLGPRLRLLGYRGDVEAWLAAADIFVLPSHFEGLPMSVIEAMLCGLPVVASDIKGPREQVVAGDTGLLVPPAQVAPLRAALGELIADPARRARMGEAGRARALALYREDRVIAHTLDLLGL